MCEKKEKQVLLISEFDHFLLQGLKEELKSRYVNSTHIFLGSITHKSKPRFILRILFAFVYILLFSKKFETVSYHYGTKYIRFIDYAARFKRMRRVCTIWGSEYSKSGITERTSLEKWYRTLNELSVTNINFVTDLVKKGFKFRDTSFGMSQFGFIDRIENNYDTYSKKITVVIGTNGSPNQQHIEVIKALLKLNNKVLSKYHFIIPMTYGGDYEYRNSVKKMVDFKHISCEFIETPLTSSKLAELRSNTDILIQVQLTDQLSGAMLESIYAGAHVVTGSWLHYQELDDLKLTWSKVGKLNELGDKITQIEPLSLNEKRDNRLKMYERYSWGVRAENWLKLLLKE